jgi:uncharacterized protein (DUF1015 family)
MAEINPFKGILYDTTKVQIEDVLAPPYDIITPEYREALYMQSPYNIVRIDFGKEEPGDNEAGNKYTRARGYLDAWIKEGVLVRSEKPSFYAYEITYLLDGVEKRLIGFLGLVKLEELGKGSVYPHECTHSKPKQDRLNLMRSCNANTSPIYALYKSSGDSPRRILSAIVMTKPYISAVDISGDIHRLWQIDREEDVEAIRQELLGKQIFIADGHHRYETAFEYYRERTSQENPGGMTPYDHVLMFLSNMGDEGVTILPTHRLLKKIPEDIDLVLSRYFATETVTGGFNIREKLSEKRRAFGFYRRGSETWQILTYREDNVCEICNDLRRTDVIVLHELVLKKISHTTEIGYEMDMGRALERVNSGEFSAAFFLNPTRVEDVEKAALSSVRMPPKSTYFYPKLLTGLVINKW